MSLQVRIFDKWTYNETMSLIGMLNSTNETDIYLAITMLYDNRYKFLLRILIPDVKKALFVADDLLRTKYSNSFWIITYTYGMRGMQRISAKEKEGIVSSNNDVNKYRDNIVTLQRRLADQKKQEKKAAQKWENGKRQYGRSARNHYS